MEDFLSRLTEGEFQSEVTANTAALAIDPDSGKIIHATSQAERIFKCAVKNGLNGQAFESLIPQEFRLQHREHVRRYLESPHARPMGPMGMTLPAQDLEGNRFPVAIALCPFKKHERLYIVLILLPRPVT